MTALHPVLTGEKVILARVRREDVPVMARHFANLELTAYLGAVGGAFSLEDEQAYFDSISKSSPDQVTFGIYTREGQTYIGGLDLRGVNHRHGTAELGVSIHDPEYWGGGYGSEAVRLMVSTACTFWGCTTSRSTCFRTTRGASRLTRRWVSVKLGAGGARCGWEGSALTRC